MSAKSRQIQKIILEEIESIKRGDDLIVQDDIEEQELGGGYSVEFGTMPEFHKISERRLRKIISSELERQTLSESLVSDTFWNGIQTLLGGLIEYAPGIAAGIPTAGVGAAPAVAAGATIQTVIDCAIAIEPIAGAVEAVNAFVNTSKQSYDLFKDLIKIVTDFQNNPDGLYDHVKKTIAKSVKLLGDKWVIKFKDQIETVISKITTALSKAIHAMIPDAAIAGTVSQFALKVANSLDNNCFDILKGLSSLLGSYGSFIFNPSETKAFFEKAITGTISLLKVAKEKVKEISYTTVATIGAATGGAGAIPALLAKAGGPAALEKAASFLQENKSTILNVVDKIVSILIPAFVGMIATIQSISNEDWNSKNIIPDKEAQSQQTSQEKPVTPQAAETTPAPPQENLAEIRKQIYQIDKSIRRLKKIKHFA